MNFHAARLFPLFTALLLACPGLGHAAAGHFQFVSGEVHVVRGAGQDYTAKKGDEVNQGDAVVTAKNATAQLRMQDGGILAVRQDTQLRIDAYNYNGKEDGSENGVFSLLKGSFRSITGAIGHINKEKLKIKTSSATIGIRGTDGEIGFNPATGLTGVHTIMGRHAVTAPDAQGIPVTVLTGPGKIVLVAPGRAPAFANSFPFASGAPKPAAKGGPAGEKSNAAGEKKNAAANGKEADTAASTTDTASTTSTSDTAGTADTTSSVITDTSGTTGTTTDSTTTLSSGPLLAPAPLLATDPNTGQLVTVTSLPSPTTTFQAYGISYAVPCPTPSFPCGSSASGPGMQITRDASGAPIAFVNTGFGGNKSISLVGYTAPTISQAPSYAVTGIEYGTWQASALNWSSTNPTASGTDTLFSGSVLHWFTGTQITPGYLTRVLTGSVNYTFDGGTAPTNQSGVAGSVVSASLAANFSNQSVDVAFNLNVNAHSWSVNALNQPINIEFFGSTPTVAIDGCTTCGANGHLDGRFTGAGADGAAISYGLSGGNTNEEVNGVLAFVNSSAPNNTATAYRPVGIAGYDPGATPSSVVNGEFNAASRVTADGSGNLVAFDGRMYTSTTTPDLSVRFAVGSATPTDLGSDANTGLVWGRWAGGNVSITNRATGATSNLANPGSLHYVAGPVLTAPTTLPLSGAYTYTFLGGTQPTDNLGNVGTLNSTALTADFGTMTVNASVSASVSGTTLTGSASAIPLKADAVASAGTAFQSNAPLSVVCSGTCGTTQAGNLSVALTGSTGQGAAMLYSLETSGGTNKVISGAAAFAR